MTNYGMLSRYPSLLWHTLVYARQVRGTTQVPPTYLIATQQTDQSRAPSDMYKLKAPKDDVTLQDYIGAFLTSPLFRLELAILKRTVTAPSLLHTLEALHLEKVASNQEDAFGNWKDHAARGDPTMVVLPNNGDIVDAAADSPTRIMRCRDNDGKPFCDTWWSLEPSLDEQGTVDLVFGTALFSSPHQQQESSNKAAQWILQALDPFHRLYSRLLLASARANLEILRTNSKQA